MEHWLQRLWYRRAFPPLWLLPFSALFALASGLWRSVTASELLRIRLSVPVVVVGNIAVGGTGKTPLSLALVEALQHRGWHPGIISRGYGASMRGINAVHPGDDPIKAGDEPVLMAARSGVPVWTGQDRGGAGRALLTAHPEVDVLISDDGLQHRALARDLEIAVVDGGRLFGNGALLPAGPLREPISRLNSVDAIVINGPLRQAFASRAPQFKMTLQGEAWINLCNPSCRVAQDHFRGQTCHGVAGIGNPERFFAFLETLGITVIPHVFPDHHAYVAEQLRFDPATPVLMTEKDGIKCQGFALHSGWMLPVSAVLDPALVALVDNTLQRRKHGRTIA